MAIAIFCGSNTPFACGQENYPWDDAGIEDFSLTERSGRTVTKGDLLGKPWLACFVFTRCAGPCPRVSGQMKLLQEKLAGTDVRLVTFTVDPKYDTTEVLQEYAKHFDADPERWLYLTGDQYVIYHLIEHSFKVPVVEMVGEDRKPGFEVLHSTNIMRVDARGRVVGKYNAADDVDMAKLRRVLLGGRDDGREEASTDDDGTAKDVNSEIPNWVLALPAVNASLNGLATLLLVGGFVFIKRGNVTAHKTAMLTAFATSILFLACYLVYHAALHRYTGTGSRAFTGTGIIRPVYFTILISHVVLAAAVPVLASMTIYRGLKSQWDKHKRIAKVTFPIWLYVSVTGVIIYAVLYHWPV